MPIPKIKALANFTLSSLRVYHLYGLLACAPFPALTQNILSSSKQTIEISISLGLIIDVNLCPDSITEMHNPCVPITTDHISIPLWYGKTNRLSFSFLFGTEKKKKSHIWLIYRYHNFSCTTHIMRSMEIMLSFTHAFCLGLSYSLKGKVLL